MNGNRQMWLTRATDLGIFTFGVAAAALLLSGCGKSHESTQSASTPVVERSTPSPAAAVAAVAGGTPAGVVATSALSQGSTSNGTDEGLPPEIALGDLETRVMPGQSIELTVYGTPDVTEMSLSDGRGERHAMWHDADRDVWTAKYRVPLRPKQERLGLSVTAKNQADRWRRVWVFLDVQPEGVADCVEEVDEPSAAPDSTTGR